MSAWMRPTSYFVIWCMLFQILSPLLLAEDAPAPEAAKTLQKKTAPVKSEESKSSEKPAEKAPEKAADTEPKSTKVLTSVSKNQAALSTNADGQIDTKFAVQDTPWREDLDLLSGDETTPVLAESVFGRKGKQRINLVADNVEVKNIMDHLATEYRLNIVSKELTSGNRIKTSLYDIPMETVFQVLLEQANLSYEKRNEIIYLQDRGKGKDYFLEEKFFKLKEFADFGYAQTLIDNIATSKAKKILPSAEKKTFFVVEYKSNLNKIEKLLSDLGYLEDMDPDSSTFYHHYLSYNYIDKKVISEIIKKYQSKDGKAIEDDKSNRFIVFDTRSKFEQMKEAVDFVDVPKGQVFIDVKFVDLTDNDSKSLGVAQTVDWNGSANANDKFSFSLATDVTKSLNLKLSPISSLGITGSREISKSKILNNPKIMVINNEKANINVTESFPYVTNENSNGVISSKILQTPIGVQLDVTPKINSNNEVEMVLSPKITVLKEVKTIITKVVDTNQANAKVTETSSEFPITDERSIQTTVVVPTGKTLVIGGLIKESDRKSADSIPGLAKLPLFGPLFKRKTKDEDRSQLYIFITPTIVSKAPDSVAFKHEQSSPQISSKDLPAGKVKGLTVESIASVPALAKATEAPLASPKMNEEVNFSSFMQKIASLKEKERVKKLKEADVKIVEENKQAGFDNLIDKLKSDIQKESAAPSLPKTISVSATVALSSEPKKKSSDQVLGERAEKIARLLQAWEDNPVEGVMKPKTDKTPPQEVKVEDKLAEQSKAKSSGTTTSSDTTDEEKSEDEEEEEGKKPQKPAEEEFKMEYFSPLGIPTTPENQKFTQPGTAEVGTVKAKAKPALKKEKESEPATDGTSGERPLKPAKTLKKLSLQRNSPSLEEEELSFEDLKPKKAEDKEISAVAEIGQVKPLADYDFKVNRQKKAKSVEGLAWEEDFLSKDKADIRVRQLEEIVDEDLQLTTRETQPVAKVIEKETIKPAEPLKIAEAVKPAAKPLVAATKAAPKPRPAEIAQKKDKEIRPDEDFEEFLGAMFTPEAPVQAKAKAPDKTKAARTTDPAEKSTGADQELQSFLDTL